MEPGQIARLLNRVGEGNQDATRSLFTEVYDQLRRSESGPSRCTRWRTRSRVDRVPRETRG